MVQTNHATWEAAKLFPTDTPETPYMVVCGVKDEAELFKAVGHIRRNGVECREYREPDAGLSLTAVTTEPVTDRRAVFRKFQLLKT